MSIRLEASEPGATDPHRGWAPTALLCLAVLLAAVIFVEAKPVTAEAAATRPHSHAVAVVGPRAEKVSVVTPGTVDSPNWSGYVAQATGNDGAFTDVSAQWTEPTVTCPKKDAWTLFWVGFDGWPSTDASVEQGGTSAQCLNGVPHYSAFYEMWPTLSVMPMFPVYAGDQISASVLYQPGAGGSQGEFVITVADTTPAHADQLSMTESCPPTLACARSSAEWIAESPAHFGTENWFPLAKYGTVDFSNATVTNAQGIAGPISDQLWADSGVNRVAGATKPVAVVSSLDNSTSGSAFSDTWRRR